MAGLDICLSLDILSTTDKISVWNLLSTHTHGYWSLDSSVSIVTKLRNPSLNREKQVFSLSKHVDPLWGPPSPLFKGYGALFPG